MAKSDLAFVFLAGLVIGAAGGLSATEFPLSIRAGSFVAPTLGVDGSALVSEGRSGSSKSPGCAPLGGARFPMKPDVTPCSAPDAGVQRLRISE